MIVCIVIVIVFDRVSWGEYEDKGGLGVEVWLCVIIILQIEIMCVIVFDGCDGVVVMLCRLCDSSDLILIIGGIGFVLCDEMFEVLVDVMEKELSGFGEEMCCVSLCEVLIVILLCQIVGICGQMLMIIIFGKFVVIVICLDVVFVVVFYCFDLIGVVWIEIDLVWIKVFCFGV